MKQTNFSGTFLARAILVAWAMAGLPALADDYASVAQLLRAGKLPEAQSQVDKFLATQPKDLRMRFIKGVLLRDAGKTPEAIAVFAQLTRDYPELPEPHNNLVVLYASQSQYDKARVSLELALRTSSSYSTAHENLSDIYGQLAGQAYTKALRLESDSVVAPIKLALIRDMADTGRVKASVPAAAVPVVPTAPPMTTAKPVAAAPATVAPVKEVASKPALPLAKPAVVEQAAPPAKPAVVAQAVPPAKPVAAPKVPVDTTHQVQAVEAAVAKWTSAWAARDVKAYLACYGKDFDPPGSMGRKAWEAERQQRISGKSSISVKVEKLSVSVSGEHAQAKFRQEYKAGGLAVASRKTLDFARVGDHWYIVKETVGN